MTIMVTGGAGFIGSNFVIGWLERHNEPVINVDKLTYAGNLENLVTLEGNSNHIFVHEDIIYTQVINQLLQDYKPHFVINFAAETHVDRSIHSPEEFIRTNIFKDQPKTDNGHGYRRISDEQGLFSSNSRTETKI